MEVLNEKMMNTEDVMMKDNDEKIKKQNGVAMEMPKDQLLSLDIGTRTVVGVLLRPENEQYCVVDYEVVEHTERAMLDGQIHDIEKVAKVVGKVVEALKERNGEISQAAIAAAGRTLMTERAYAEIDLDITKEIDKEVTDMLQMLAVQEAQNKINVGIKTKPEIVGELEKAPEQLEIDVVKDIGADESVPKNVKSALSADDYYTVGHSVIEYKLDDSFIINPHGHRGQKLSVEIIATFLPHIVVDSLYTVLSRVGLDVLNLTLEPIAAMNVAIPKKLRMLNLALVDIGAGTSDIAISKDGTIHSYGMVSMAGDSLTELIAQEYLMEFNAAEELKVFSSYLDELEYVDVLGLPHKIKAEEVHQKAAETVDKLTQKISDNIKELNGKAPSAVFLMGGGSQFKGIKEKLSEKLEIPEERVAIKTIEQLDMVTYKVQPPKGPEFITPIGIGVTAVEERDHDFLQVTVSGTSIRIFNTSNVKLSDALLLSGYNARSLLSERGPSIFVTVDGEKKELRGAFGEPARIIVNGKPASLDSPISHKDQIVVMPATPGEARVVKLGELLKEERCCYIGEAKIKLVDYVSVGGVNRTEDYILKDGDEIVLKGAKTIHDLSKRAELDLKLFKIMLNGIEQEEDDNVVNGAVYELEKRDIEEVAEIAMATVDEAVDTSKIEVLVNGKPYSVPEGSVFVDLFDIIGFDSSQIGIEQVGDKKLEILLNEQPASFLDPLEENDRAVIRLRKRTE